MERVVDDGNSTGPKLGDPDDFGSMSDYFHRIKPLLDAIVKLERERHRLFGTDPKLWSVKSEPPVRSPDACSSS